MADHEARVKIFSYTEDILEDLEASLSRERISTYLDAAQGNREQTVRLYTWNTAVSAAFYGPLQGLEVALRNAMHRQLAERYGPTWYDNSNAGLDTGALDRVHRATSELQRAGHEKNASRIVPALSFGFWVSLLGRGGYIESDRKANYEMTLWRPALRRAFLHCAPLTRRNAHGPLNALRILRNRIAHHEPIFARDLAEDYERILTTAGWISPGTQAWINHHSRVPVLLEAQRDVEELRF